MIFAVASLVLPCLTSAPPPVTFARPADPQYVAMTHIRRTPAPICEPLALAPLVAGPEPLVELADAPLAPPVPFVPPEAPYVPLAWGPLDWPADSIAYGGGSWAGGFGGGGGSGGGGGYYAPPPVIVAVVPEPQPLALLLLGLVGLVARKRSA